MRSKSMGQSLYHQHDVAKRSSRSQALESFPIPSIWETGRLYVCGKIGRLDFLLLNVFGSISLGLLIRRSRSSSRPWGSSQKEQRTNLGQRGKPSRHVAISDKHVLCRSCIVASCQDIPWPYFVLNPHKLVVEIPLLHKGYSPLLAKGWWLLCFLHGWNNISLSPSSSKFFVLTCPRPPHVHCFLSFSLPYDLTLAK